MNVKNTFVAGVIASAMFGLAGCSDDNPAPPPPEEPTTYELLDPLAAQVALIEIHDPTGIPSVTIASQAADIELSGTATRTGTDVDVMLTATNNAPRILFNLKAVVTNTNLGIATITGSDGTLDTMDFVRFEKMGLAEEDSSESGALTISNANGAVDPLVIEVTLPTDQPLGVVSASDCCGTAGDVLTMVDLKANQSIGVDFNKLNNPNGNRNGSNSLRLRQGVFSPEGQYVYLGHRNMPWVVRADVTTYNGDTGSMDHVMLDLNTGNMVSPDDLPDPSTTDTKTIIAYTDWVAMSPDQQYLYTAYLTGGHAYGSSSYTSPQSISLVKIDRANMEIMGSVELVSDSPVEPRVRDYDFNGDSTMVVILESDDETVTPASVISIDLDAMEVSSTVNISPLNTATKTTATPDNEPTQMALNADGTVAYVANRGEVDFFTVNLASGDTALMDVAAITSSWIHELDMGPDGKLYVATEGDGVVSIDPANSNAEAVIHTTTGTTMTFAFSADGSSIYVKDRDVGNIVSIFGYALSDGSQLDLDGDSTVLAPGNADTINGTGIWDETILVSPY